MVYITINRRAEASMA